MKHLAVDVHILVKVSVREVVEDSVRQHVEDVKIVLEHVQLFAWELVVIIVMGVLVDVLIIVL